MAEEIELEDFKAFIADFRDLVQEFRERRHLENEALHELRRLRKAVEALVTKPDLPVGFRVTVNPFDQFPKENTMSTVTVNLQILDDGKGVKYVFTPVKADGSATTLPPGVVPSYTSSNPVMDVAPDPADTTGLTCLGTIHVPASDAAGVVVSISATLPTGKVITLDAPAVDVVPDPNNANNPVGFTVAETAA